jgi:hypothetical protein
MDMKLNIFPSTTWFQMYYALPSWSWQRLFRYMLNIRLHGALGLVATAAPPHGREVMLEFGDYISILFGSGCME